MEVQAIEKDFLWIKSEKYLTSESNLIFHLRKLFENDINEIFETKVFLKYPKTFHMSIVIFLQFIKMSKCIRLNVKTN